MDDAAIASCISLGDYVDLCASSFGQHPVLGLSISKDSIAPFETFTAKQIQLAVNQAIIYYNDVGLTAVAPRESKVVALLNPGDLTYAASFFALLKLGYTVLLLSMRLPVLVASKVLKVAKCEVLIYGKHVHSKVEEMRGFEEESNLLLYIPICSRSRLEKRSSNATVPKYSVPSSKVAYILHSSGSTGIPKIFAMTHQSALTRIQAILKHSPYAKSVFVTSSMFNSAGLIQLLLSFRRNAPAYFYNDHLKWTPDGLSAAIAKSQVNVARLTPRALAMVASTQAGIDILRGCSNVVNVGAVCPSDLGNRLVREGITFSTVYAL
jgi:acyl-coenzyme A synthetase/AMP-(fatty) acid ligase